MTGSGVVTPTRKEAEQVIEELMARARDAQRRFESFTQDQVDEVVTAIAWACYREDRAEELAQIAVEDTSMGNVPDKVKKIQRKTMGTLRDLQGAKSVGTLREIPDVGITEIAKPVGIVAALSPLTNPEATPVNKAMMALKGRNAVILSPSPRGIRTCARAVAFMHEQMDRCGAPRGLIQYVARPSKELALELMRQADLVVVTGSQKNVRAAYSSGTPAIGGGVGNATVIVEEGADIRDAASKIRMSKVFDYATSCSSENSLLIQSSIYEEVIAALKAEGGYLCSPTEKARLQEIMWVDGKLSPNILAKPPAVIARLAGLSAAERAGFFMVEEGRIGAEHPFSGEKLSVVLTVYRFETFEEALEKTQGILDYQGSGHSCGIHTDNEQHAHRLADEIRVARVLVNQAHCFANGGSFDNGLNFTLTMGCGTWGGNSISENLSYKHFLNVTTLVRPIVPREPTEEELWGAYLAKHGR